MPSEKTNLSQSNCSPDEAKRNPGRRYKAPGCRRCAPLSGLHYLIDRLRNLPGNDMIRTRMGTFWRAVRQLSGDDAYERYLAHHAAHHSGQPLLTRAEFFRRWQDEKWSGMRRCC